MEQRFLQLAETAVGALQEPSWVEIAQLGVSCLTLVVSSVLVLYGLRQMSKASDARNRQLDQQGEVLGKIGEGITEMLRRTA